MNLGFLCSSLTVTTEKGNFLFTFHLSSDAKLETRFSQKENALALKSKKAQGIFGETFILRLSSSGAFRLQNRISFNLFRSEEKEAFSDFHEEMRFISRV